MSSEITLAENADFPTVSYKADGVQIDLTEDAVRQIVCQGRDDVPAVEVARFMFTCQARGLNPWTDVNPTVHGRGADARISVVVSKDTFTRRAQRNPKYKGHEAGITVLTADGTQLLRRDGALVMGGETICGGWARVYIDGWEKPFFNEVSFCEYDTGKALWSTKPATMIRKVALVQALREAFPDDFGGVYDEAEMA